MFDPDPQKNENPSPVVSNVEKISAIVTPYFIALVGLLLYDNNILLGTALVIVGILTLLKVSVEDLGRYWQELKKAINSKNE
jgi:hypothetical protein